MKKFTGTPYSVAEIDVRRRSGKPRTIAEALDFAQPILISNELQDIRDFSLDNFLTSLDNTGSTVYKLISLVDGRVLSGL